MKCSLVFLPIWKAYTPPLSLGYLKGALMAASIECETFDFAKRFEPVMLSARGDVEGEKVILGNPTLIEEWVSEILNSKPSVIAFSILESNFAVTKEVAKKIRQRDPDMPLFGGGLCFTPEQMHYIEPALSFLDFVVQGEGEKLIADLVRLASEHKDVKQLKQIWALDGAGKAVFSGNDDLDILDTKPFPNFDGYDLKQYPLYGGLPMVFSRGCVLNCNFCTNKWNDKTQRTRSGANVFEELVRNKNVYNIERFIFNDDSLISKVTLKEIEDFCDRAIASDLVLPWSVYRTRIERLLTPPYIAKLRKAGLSEIALGVESFSSTVQKAMGKSADFEITDRVVRMFADEGISTRSWIIYGYPTETDADFDVTYNWIKEHGHLLSGIWVNSFNLNGRQLTTRPGSGTYFGHQPWMWNSQESTVAKRKDRFLRLINLIHEISLSNKIQYSIGDPFLTKYFTSWSMNDQNFIIDHWDQTEKIQLRNPTQLSH